MTNESLENIKAIFFDLDGTLLDVNEEDFMKKYLGAIYPRFKDKIDFEGFTKYLLEGTADMMKNEDPDKTSLEAFGDSFIKKTGFSLEFTMDQFLGFYQNEFQTIRDVVKPNIARKLVDLLQSMDKTLILATNPIFPQVATVERCAWINLEFSDFLYVSHAENSSYCKPNPKYYQELVEMTGYKPEEILMVGNSYLYDMAASKLGIKTWMVDTNQEGMDYKNAFKVDYEGSLNKLYETFANSKNST